MHNVAGDQRWNLLWRSSRDGATPGHFHARCDGYPRTLTLVRDTAGAAFGGYTPLPWESRVHNGQFGVNNNCYSRDESGASFIFTLKNPDNFPPRKFRLLPNERRRAIYCCSIHGPMFGRGGEVEVFYNRPDNGRTSGFGNAYENNTGRAGRTFLTGAKEFTVGEVEVFALTD